MKFRNEYKQLKQENNLIFSTLAECDRDTITDILNTISNSRGINYDVELVRKDLIAMAASAEADGQYLPAVIGDVETFKLDLLASIPHPKLIDYMLDSLVWMCIYGLAMSTTYLLLRGAWDSYFDAAMLGICIVVMLPSAWLMQRIVPASWAFLRQGAALWQCADGAAGVVACGVWADLQLGLPQSAQHWHPQRGGRRAVCGAYPGLARLAHPPLQSVGRCPPLA